MDVNGRSVIVTGASRGIGKQIAVVATDLGDDLTPAALSRPRVVRAAIPAAIPTDTVTYLVISDEPTQWTGQIGRAAAFMKEHST